jgi:hypothetical protein
MTLHLPPALERKTLEREVRASVRQAKVWFRHEGLDVPHEEIITEVWVFDDRAVLRTALAARFGVEVASIPDGFAGTVDGSTLLVVTPELYRETFTQLYPGESWSADEHRMLMVHEIAHGVHARIARERFGTEDAMGPRWFFEGLAIDCAEQFPASGGVAAPLPWPTIVELIELDNQNAIPKPIYPTYARIFRSLRSRVPVGWLIEHAKDDDFLEQVGRAYQRTAHAESNVSHANSMKARPLLALGDGWPRDTLRGPDD